MVLLETTLSSVSKYLGRAITAEELGNALWTFGLELDSVEGDAIRVEVTPDRPDMLSPQGLARALKSYLGLKLGQQGYSVLNSGIEVIVEPSVESVRPKTVAAVVKGLELNDERIREIIWVQEKLHNTFARGRKKAALGIYPLEKITPPIHYRALPPKTVTFHPLEAASEMTGWDVLEKHATGKAYAHLLHGHELFPFFVDSKGQVLSMPPIINSHTIGKVTEQTRDVFVEVSGRDLKALKQLLHIIVTMLADMGGSVCSVKMKYYDSTGKVEEFDSPNLKAEKFKLSMQSVREVLGVHLTTEEVVHFLQRMGHNAEVESSEVLRVWVPAYRVDVLHEVDLIDDVGRALTFDKIPAKLPNLATAAELKPDTLASDRLRELFLGFKFQEVFTLALTNKETQVRRMILQEDVPNVRLPVGESRAEGIDMVRAWLAPELLRVFQANRHKSFPQNIFEVDYVVVPDEKADSKARNVLKACAFSSHSKAGFSEMKSVLESVCASMGWTLSLTPEDRPYCLPGRRVLLIVNGKKGWLGELHPQVLENFGLENPVAGFEFEV